MDASNDPTNLTQAGIIFLQILLTTTVPGLFVYLNKKNQTDKEAEIARIKAKADRAIADAHAKAAASEATPRLVEAQTDLQVELAKAAESLIEPLNRQIFALEEQVQSMLEREVIKDKRIEALNAELISLRNRLRIKDEQVKALNAEVSALRQRELTAQQKVEAQDKVIEELNRKIDELEKSLDLERRKVAQLKAELGTGPLSDLEEV